MDFPSAVAVPPTSAYAPKPEDFSWISNLANQYFGGKKNAFDQQQRDLVTKEQQAFASGIPTDGNGNPDYRAITARLAQIGDINAIQQLAPYVSVQNQGNINPVTAQLLGLPAQGGAVTPAAQPAPQQPSTPLAQRTPATYQGGDAGTGTITDIVSGRIADNNQAGPVIARIAQVTGIDPNAPLSAGQQVRVNGLVKRYTPADTTQATTTAPAGATSATGRVDSAFAALPPSANATTPAPKMQPRAQQQPAPQAQAAPPAQPLVPQFPLPINPATGKPFTDPMQAIAAIDRVMIGERNPQALAALKDMRDRIAESAATVKMGGNDTFLDPRSGQVIARGPGAAAAANAEPSPTLDADAERYRQTGTLPPNMGRGIQGQQQASAIRTRAVELETADGGSPADWPERWQQFATTAAGRRVLANRAANLTLAENESETLIPRVREISAKVSRTNYPTINSLILAAQKGTGGEDVIKLGVAVSSLIPVYARVLKPTGQITEGDTNRAHDILDKAWSDGQINAALDQMQVELKSARAALTKTQKEFANRGGGGGDDSAPASSSSATTAASHPAPPSGFQLVK